MALADFNNKVDGTIIELEDFEYMYNAAKNIWVCYKPSKLVVLTNDMMDMVNGLNSLREIRTSDYLKNGGTLQIPSNYWIWSDDTSVPALIVDTPGATIINEGNIIGKGGKGGGQGSAAGQPGGPAISIISAGVTIEQVAGGFIAGGGGGGRCGTGRSAGGGGGAGGGDGGPSDGAYGSGENFGVGGTLGQTGSNGGGSEDTTGGAGGGAGGAGGGYDGPSQYDNSDAGAGGGGGRILPGVGGNNNANGGSAGNVGSNGGERGAGGGGWGAAGGSVGGNAGGAGGAAISTTENYTLNNAGTIYGAV